ncbi:MAG: hypothetical protein SF053_13105 [Bacteroidia bacterium]|nr:hypothetical protein [Bacteroidia bacterium]
MSDRMHHRVPDGQGFLFSAEVPADFVSCLQTECPEAIISQRPLRRAMALGHRRLSILDLSPLAGQPMHSYDDQAWITFNGEIYNYTTLREGLIHLGYQFRKDHSDAEVIVHAYHTWGTDAVKKLLGMFTFALYDNREDVLWIVRDRVGIKPLYFTLHQDRMHFASEIKALLVDTSIPRRMSDQGVYNYLTFQRVPPSDIIFEGIPQTKRKGKKVYF